MCPGGSHFREVHKPPFSRGASVDLLCCQRQTVVHESQNRGTQPSGGNAARRGHLFHKPPISRGASFRREDANANCAVHESPQSRDNNFVQSLHRPVEHLHEPPISRGASVQSQTSSAAWPSNSSCNTSFRKPIDALSNDFLRFEWFAHDAINSRHDQSGPTSQAQGHSKARRLTLSNVSMGSSGQRIGPRPR